MEGNYITKEVHEEFARRIESEHKRLSEEDKRQNARIADLESNVKEIQKLTISMERMSANMQSMLEAIERQGNLLEKQVNRIDEMEREPAGRWKGIKGKAVDTAVNVIITAIVIGLFALAAQYIK